MSENRKIFLASAKLCNASGCDKAEGSTCSRITDVLLAETGWLTLFSSPLKGLCAWKEYTGCLFIVLLLA